MGPSGKWIDGISPDASVVDAARASLAARLTAVAHWLPLAAYHAGQDVEHVHRLRVSTRRAVAALRLYRDWLPAKNRRWIKKQLKKTRRAAGEARDLDVLAERIERELGESVAPILAELHQLRHSAQPTIINVAEKCRRDDRFVRKIAKLVDGIRPPHHERSGEPDRFRDWAEKKFAQSACDFFSSMPTAGSDATALHQFRIRAKSLRYVMELLAPAFGPEFRDVHYSVVEELQERLGRIQDCVAGAARLRERARSARHAHQAQLLEDFAAQQEARRSQLIAEFDDWWTAERVDALKIGLLMTREGAATAEPTEPTRSPHHRKALCQTSPAIP